MLRQGSALVAKQRLFLGSEHPHCPLVRLSVGQSLMPRRHAGGVDVTSDEPASEVAAHDGGGKRLGTRIDDQRARTPNMNAVG